jgi:oligoendopeptidase F
VTFGRLLADTTDPEARLALLAESLEGQIATVFRQIAMNRFEDQVHRERRERGELSVERFGEHWFETQTDMLGDAVELTGGYRSWWSYIPHFIGTPGYVYAYAYGQLLALAVYRQYERQGAAFVPSYLELLARGGSEAPEELGRIVGVDLTDPGFWDGGLAIVEEQLRAAEDAAHASGRLSDPDPQHR